MTTHLTDTLIFTLLGFAVIYPVFLWFTPRSRINSGFYNFNLGLSGTIGGMALIIAWAVGLESVHLYGGAGWLSLHLLITFLNWNKEKVFYPIIAFSSTVGIVVFIFFTATIIPYNNGYILAWMVVITQGIVAGILFSMILGHWYLNVIQLPINLLKRTTNFISILLGIRLIWNIYQFNFTNVVNAYEETLSLIQFSQTLDGFFLGVAVFFGLVVPLILQLYISRTLKLHATQSATGLLYISVLVVLIGDLCYKYILFQNGLLL